MRRFLIILALLLIAAAYVGGYWPEHRQLTITRNELQAAKKQLSDAQAEIRMYQLENQLLAMVESATERNYGQAQKLSTEFFNAVRWEVDRTDRQSFKETLNSALQKRDAITIDLTQGNPAVLDLLHQLLNDFRHTLGTTTSTSGAGES